MVYWVKLEILYQHVHMVSFARHLGLKEKFSMVLNLRKKMIDNYIIQCYLFIQGYHISTELL